MPVTRTSQSAGRQGVDTRRVVGGVLVRRRAEQQAGERAGRFRSPFSAVTDSRALRSSLGRGRAAQKIGHAV